MLVWLLHPTPLPSRIATLSSRWRHGIAYPQSIHLPFMPKQADWFLTGLTQLPNFRAGYVDKLLAGARPTELPVQFPTQFELVVNLTTANIPASLLSLADD